MVEGLVVSNFGLSAISENVSTSPPAASFVRALPERSSSWVRYSADCAPRGPTPSRRAAPTLKVLTPATALIRISVCDTLTE
jgi:hypothetical protein